jgi:nicotinamidase-related amidase
MKGGNKQMRIWEKFLTDNDGKFLKSEVRGKTRGRSIGLGASPALLVVDVQYMFVGGDKTILEQLDRWPLGAGENGWKAIRNIKQLIGVAREVNIPVIYIRSVYPEDDKFNAFVKGARQNDRNKEAEELQIVSDIAPKPGDIVINKSWPSALLATPLVTYLNKLKIDTLIVTGVRTSQCVRACVVDAFSHLFRAAVVEDCVFDQMEVSHAVALLDMWLNYADVINFKEAIDYMKAL